MARPIGRASEEPASMTTIRPNQHATFGETQPTTAPPPTVARLQPVLEHRVARATAEGEPSR